MILADLQHKIVGVWGYGIVGKSTIAYLRERDIAVALCESRELSATQRALLQQQNVIFFPQQEQLAVFLATCDYIIPSGGIDIRPYASFVHKWLPELDLFQLIMQEHQEALGTTVSGVSPCVIAITGTIGKTTVTHTLYQLLQAAGKKVGLGGNIGVALCELAAQLASLEYIVLEVSSFQLEHCHFFRPHVALWTNLFGNHLDRHETMAAYAAAKARITALQHKRDVFIAPWNLLNEDSIQSLPETGVERYFCAPVPPTMHTLTRLRDNDTLITIEEGHVIAFSPLHGMWPVAYSLPAEGFVDNWLLLAATLYALGLETSLLQQHLVRDETLAHRLMTVATRNGITYIDDSKATIMESTMAAVRACQPQPVILLLGGLSKGVDRAPYIAALSSQVKAIICFGQEALQLAHAVDAQYTQPAIAQDLAQALTQAHAVAQEGDVILLSPGGSSYDLYANYKERGKHFAQLVESN